MTKTAREPIIIGEPKAAMELDFADAPAPVVENALTAQPIEPAAVVIDPIEAAPAAPEPPPPPIGQKVRSGFFPAAAAPKAGSNDHCERCASKRFWMRAGIGVCANCSPWHGVIPNNVHFFSTMA